MTSKPTRYQKRSGNLEMADLRRKQRRKKPYVAILWSAKIFIRRNGNRSESLMLGNAEDRKLLPWVVPLDGARQGSSCLGWYLLMAHVKEALALGGTYEGHAQDNDPMNLQRLESKRTSRSSVNDMPGVHLHPRECLGRFATAFQ
ncbi:hypothetical protein SDJN03_16681, partial [Cucurbita argyrosperma subsp. sororia]